MPRHFPEPSDLAVGLAAVMEGMELTLEDLPPEEQERLLAAAQGQTQEEAPAEAAGDES